MQLIHAFQLLSLLRFLWKAMNVALSASPAQLSPSWTPRRSPSSVLAAKYTALSHHQITILLFQSSSGVTNTLPFSSRSLNYSPLNLGGKSDTSNLAELLIKVKLTLPQSFNGYQGPPSFTLLNVSAMWGQHSDLQICLIP